MTELYFQWQNDFLQKTIYPLREMKLRDFLVYYREIELWAEYKDRSPASLQAEIEEYIKAQTQVMVDAVDAFSNLRNYFLGEVQPETTEQLPKEVLDEYAKINKLHQNFNFYLPNYHNVRKEKIFVAQRVTEWETHCKELAILARKRQLTGENTKNKALGLAEAELARLHELLSIYNKIDQRRSSLIKPREDALRKKQMVESELNPLKGKIGKQQAKVKETQATLKHLTARPSLESVEQYFSAANISEQVRQIFQGADINLLNRFSGIRKTLSLIVTRTKDNHVKLVFIKTEIEKMKQLRKEIENKITSLELSLFNPATNPVQKVKAESALSKLREIKLNAVLSELDQEVPVKIQITSHDLCF